MKNPWHDLPRKAPFVLEQDRHFIDLFNAGRGRRRNYEIRTNRFPEAFLGRMDAPLLILCGNPRSREADETAAEHFFSLHPAALDAARDNLLHVATEFAFWTLNPAWSEFSGSGWWRRVLNGLIKSAGSDGVRRVADNLLCVEYFPYHTEDGTDFPGLPSQEYSFWLVRDAIERGAAIVVMRGKRKWLEAVPALEGYSRTFFVRNVQRGFVSMGNLPPAGGNAVWTQ